MYGADNAIVSASTSFWVIPYKLLAVGAVLITLFVLVVKRYNKYIIKRAQKEMGDGPKKTKSEKKSK